MFASTIGRSVLSWRFISLIISLHIVVLHTRLLASSVVKLSPLLGQRVLLVLVGVSPHVLGASITARNLWMLTTLSSLLLADSRISIASRFEVVDEFVSSHLAVLILLLLIEILLDPKVGCFIASTLGSSIVPLIIRYSVIALRITLSIKLRAFSIEKLSPLLGQSILILGFIHQVLQIGDEFPIFNLLSASIARHHQD